MLKKINEFDRCCGTTCDKDKLAKDYLELELIINAKQEEIDEVDLINFELQEKIKVLEFTVKIFKDRIDQLLEKYENYSTERKH